MNQNLINWRKEQEEEMGLYRSNISQSKRRGRPKKIKTSVANHSQSVQASIRDDEAIKTWQLGVALGMSSDNDQGVIQLLRRFERGMDPPAS